MEATKLIVEYLVAGILMVVATLLAAVSWWFPSGINGLTPSVKPPTSTNDFILTAVFIALSYAVGLVSEYGGEKTFEWLSDRIRRRHMVEYVKTHQAILKNSPILSPFVKGKRDVNDLAECMGQMRFFVMNHSAPLYANIDAQISRFRLLRVLFLVEVIILIAVVGQLSHGFTLVWFAAFILTISIAALNFMAIRSRFGRYYRAIERSYLVLMYDQDELENTDDKKLAPKDQSRGVLL
jgi:hypothetical protein